MTTEDSSLVPDYLNRLLLEGRNYIVLGAGLGMGRQTCHALAQAGAAKILCVDIEESRAAAVASEIGVGIPWHGDVTKREEVRRLGGDAVAALGTINGFVDIIGMAQWKSILEIDDTMWDRDFDINLRHAYLCSQELGKLMISTGGGTMVFIASVSGLSAAPMHAGYGAAKAALMAWVQSLAVELGPLNIRSNAIAPGTILTPRIDAIFTPEQRASNEAGVPLGRLGYTSDIASAALFLTSDLSAFITGRTIVVDGGVDAKFPYQTL